MCGYSEGSTTFDVCFEKVLLPCHETKNGKRENSREIGGGKLLQNFNFSLRNSVSENKSNKNLLKEV